MLPNAACVLYHSRFAELFLEIELYDMGVPLICVTLPSALY